MAKWRSLTGGLVCGSRIETTRVTAAHSSSSPSSAPFDDDEHGRLRGVQNGLTADDVEVGVAGGESSATTAGTAAATAAEGVDNDEAEEADIDEAVNDATAARPSAGGGISRGGNAVWSDSSAPPFSDASSESGVACGRAACGATIGGTRCGGSCQCGDNKAADRNELRNRTLRCTRQSLSKARK